MPGEVRIESFASQVLAGNPLNDPASRRFPVYLPPGYEVGTARYPTIYVLAGFSGTGLGVENHSGWGESLSQRLDRLIEAGECEPIIVVSPDCFTRFGGSQFLNSGAVGRYEDYLVDEVVSYVDSRFRTVARAGGRALMGKSSGGFGALIHLMRHPDVFGAAACHAGDMAFEQCYVPDFPKVVNALGESPDPLAFIEAFLLKQKKPGKDFPVMNILCMAACYSPNPDSPWGFDLPFDLHTGALREDVWARWLEWDPLRMADAHVDALKAARALFIDCGSRDNFNLHLGARQLVQRLEGLGVEHEYEEYPDDHFGLTYRYDVSIPKLVAALERA